MTCPNCGNPYLEKIEFTSGITIWRETDEICLHTTDGADILYLHLDGGDGKNNNMSRKEKQKVDRKSGS